MRISPKTLLFQTRGPELAAEYHPDPFANWQYTQQQVNLIDHKGRRRVEVTADNITLIVDRVAPMPAQLRHFAGMCEVYLQRVGKLSRPSRLGLRILYLNEGSSFAQTHPRFFENTLKTEWLDALDREVYDIGIHSLLTGTEGDGLRLSTGVLTADQVKDQKNKYDFEGKATGADIERGALLVDLDRYVSEVAVDELSKTLLAWTKELKATADQLGTALLK